MCSPWVSDNSSAVLRGGNPDAPDCTKTSVAQTGHTAMHDDAAAVCVHRSCSDVRQEKQVAQLRERSKLPSHAAGGHAQQPAAAQGQDDLCQKQQDGPTANGSAAQEAANGGGGVEDEDESHSIHHYSQQRPAEVGPMCSRMHCMWSVSLHAFACAEASSRDSGPFNR